MSAVIDSRPPAAPEPPEASTSPWRVPGEVGTWVFIFGDLLVFAGFFAAYLDRRLDMPELFAEAQTELNQDFGAANTVILLISSLFVVLAVHSLKSPHLVRWTPRFVAAAWICGAAFLVIKTFEYAEKVDHGITPETNEFFMYYFLLTGIHGFHVVIGLVLLTLMYRIGRKKQVTESEFIFFEGGACFWHMVDLLWIVLFPLLFLVR